MEFSRRTMAFLGLLLISVRSVSSANILAYFPFPARSHHIIYRPIIEELAARGHQITYVTPFPLENPWPNITTVSTEKILQKGLKDSGIFQRMPQSFFRQLFLVEKTIRRTVFEETMRIDDVRNLIHSGKRFDLILHGIFLQEHAAAFQFKFHAPGVTVCSLSDYSWMNELAGAPDNPAFMMNYHRSLSDDMTFAERVVNTLTLYTSTAWNYYELYNMERDIDAVFNFTGFNARPPLSELIADQALILSHSHHAVSYPFPRAPHLKQIGGIAVPKSKPLPQDLRNFIDESEDGIIYFSFGSTITASNLLTTSERDSFAEAFASMKERVIWKWEAGEWNGMPKNIKVASWFPQPDILAHEKCKVFISQGGLLSLFEAVNFKVPLVVIPFFGDQAKNAQFITSASIGVQLDADNITRGSVTWAVQEAVTNDKFKQEIRRRSQWLKDSPDPKDEAIRWIEYVLKHGWALQPKGARFSFIKLHSLDVKAVFVASIAFCLIMISTLFKWMGNFAVKAVLPSVRTMKKDQ